MTRRAKAMRERSGQVRERRDVERSAKHLVADPTQAELAGTLSGPSPASSSGSTPSGPPAPCCCCATRAGEAEPVKKIVYFSDGYPVSVRSNVLGECLGQILLEQKLITGSALDESLRADAAREAAAGADPGRDGGAVAVQPRTGAGRADGGQAVRDLLVAHGKFAFKADDIARARDRAAGRVAGGPDPRGHPPTLRRRPPGIGAEPRTPGNTSPSPRTRCCACRT